MKRNKIVRTLALTLGILSLPVICNGTFIKDTGILQEASAVSVVSQYTDLQGVTYTLYSDNTAQTKAGTKITGSTNYYGIPGSTILSQDIVIPETISYNETTYRVTGIGDYSFCRYTDKIDIASIKLPESIEYIGNYAFANCYRLSKINFSESLTRIGERAFMSAGITDFTFPDGVTNIGDYAFSHCKALRNLTIPDKVTKVPAGMYQMVSYATSLTIPNTVTEIGDSAFYNVGPLTEVYIPDSVTTIGVQSFTGLSSLTKVRMSNNISSISTEAFRSCNALTSIQANNQIVKSNDMMNFNYKAYFYDEDNTTVLGSYWCKNGANLEDQENPTKEGKEFSGWKSSTVSTVDNISCNTSFTAQYEDPALPNIQYTDSQNINFILNPNNSTAVVKAGTSTTSGSPNATGDITVTSTIVYEGNTYVVKEIADYAFYGSPITSINIEDGVEKVADSAFNSTKALTEATLPGSLNYIGKMAFSSCSNLKKVTMGEGLNNIQSFAFYRCYKLDTINIPTSCTNIASNLFNSCSELKYLSTTSANIGTLNIDEFVHKVKLYDSDRATVLNNLVTKNGADLSDIQAEDKEGLAFSGWETLIGLSSIDNIEGDSQFIASYSQNKIDSPIVSVSNQTPNNRENITITIE